MSDTVTDRPPCALCGVHGRPDEIRTLVVEWIEPSPGRLFDAVPRCEDRLACRQRVEAKVPAERWPIVHMSGDPWPKDGAIDGPPPPPPASERPAIAPHPSADGVVAAEPAPPITPIPPTWSPTFVDEPEEERSWI